MTGDSSSILGEERSAQLSVTALDHQIAAHKKADEDRSVLQWAVSQIWRSDEGSLSQLEKLQEEAREAQKRGDTAHLQQMTGRISTAIQTDQDAVGLQSEISHYSGHGIKTAALFFGGSKAGFLANRGTYGLAATVGLYGLDQASLSNDATTFATNFAAGGAKGGLTKALFHGLGNMPIQSPAGKGIVLGMGARVIDTGFTPTNYTDGQGNFSMSAGLGKVWHTATDTRAMVMDAALFSAAHGLTRGANMLTRGAVDKSPMANTILTSTSFGLSGGAYTEMDRQLKAGETLDYTKIAQRALLQGGIDALAGVPGGLNADAGFRNSVMNKLNTLRTPSQFANAADAMPHSFEQPTSLRRATDGRGSGETTGTDKVATPADNLRTALEKASTPAEIGAALDSVLGAAREVVGGKAATPPAEKPIAPVAEKPVTPAAEKPVAPAERVASGTGEKVATATGEKVATATGEKVESATGEKVDLAGGEKIGERKSILSEKLVEVNPAIGPESPASAKAAIDSMIPKLTGKTAPPDAVRELVEYLKSHPEADHYVADTYVRNFGNSAIRRALEAFYKPPYAMENEAALAKPAVREAYQKFEAAINNDGNRSILPEIWGKRINNLIQRAGADGPELRDVIEHHARTTYDVVAAKAIDAALGTKYADGLKSGGVESRNFALSAEDLSYLQALARGERPPLPKNNAGAQTETVADPREKVAGADAARTRHVEELARAATQGQSERILAQAEQLRSGTQAEKIAAAEKLADQLHHESAGDWFGEWLKIAPETNLSGVRKLAAPEVQALTDLAPDAVHRFFAANNPGVGLDYRINSLSEIATTFQKTPQVAVELLNVAGDNPTAMRQIAFEVTRGFGAKAYQDWLAKQLTAPTDGTPFVRPTVEQISGDGAIRRARIAVAFGDGPVARHLEAFTDANPVLAQELLKKLPQPGAEAPPPGKPGMPPRPPKGQDFQELLRQRIERRIAEGTDPLAKPEQLSPDLMNLEIRLRNSFRKNPQAMDTLVEFARNNLQAVDGLMKMPGMVEQKPQGRGPKPAFDRNDPQLKLSRAYVDFMGMIAPKAAMLGAAEGLVVMQKVQGQFADVITKQKAAAGRPDDLNLRQAARDAEIELNRLTNPLLPDNRAIVDDAHARREAVAKQDANLIPRREPPEFTMQSDAELQPRVEPTPERQPEVRSDPEVRTEPEVRTDAEVQPRVGEPKVEGHNEPPVITEPKVRGDGIDMGRHGPTETIETLNEVAPPRRRATPPLVDQAALDLIAAEEAARQQSWRARKGKNDQYEDGEGDGGRQRGKKKGGGGGRPRDWRRANQGDDYYDE